MSEKPIQVICISGPTASGKSRLSQAIKKEKGCTKVFSIKSKESEGNVESITKAKEELKEKEFIVVEGDYIF